MVYSVDQLKSVLSQRQGLAKANLFKVFLPAITNVTTSDFNMLCKDIGLPGRQLSTRDRNIGSRHEKIAYEYIVDDVVATFHVTNDYAVRKYFEAWQNLAFDQTTFENNYKKEYCRDIKIQQLKTPNFVPVYTEQVLTSDTGQQYTIEPDEVVYTCTLLEAFPTAISVIPFTDDPDGLVQLQVTFAYTNWKSS
jgi:hypothetical protein